MIGFDGLFAYCSVTWHAAGMLPDIRVSQMPSSSTYMNPQDRVALTIEPGERIVVPGSSSTLMELDAESPIYKGILQVGPQQRI
jgi:hypothetical protein